MMVALLPLMANSQSNKHSKKIMGSGAAASGIYPNLLRDAGYSKTDIDSKVANAYHDVFEGPNKVYFEVGDSMAYVSDVKNHDARTEGLSYGMMIAVQLNKKDVFDRIWRWSKKYLQHQDGPREAYFAWSINPTTMKRNSEGSASDGELYSYRLLRRGPEDIGCHVEKGRHRQYSSFNQHGGQTNFLCARRRRVWMD